VALISIVAVISTNIYKFSYGCHIFLHYWKPCTIVDIYALSKNDMVPVQRFCSFKTENGSYIRTRNCACAVPSVTVGNIGWKMRWLNFGVPSDY
jgi:hypothetical protein